LHNFAPKLAAKFLLVEWEREDSYSVVSSCQIKKGSIGQTVAVGDQVVITSGGQDYDARIMKTGNLCSHPIAHFLFARVSVPEQGRRHRGAGEASPPPLPSPNMPYLVL